MTRRTTHPVHIGQLTIGGTAPVAVQSMTTCSTMDTTGCIEQAIRIIEAGGQLVRLTTQGTREAENLRNIKAGLAQRGYAHIPLCADVHFNPNVADVAATIVEKVRINPGNYRRVPGRAKPSRRAVLPLSRHLPPPPHSHTHRRQPRLPLRPHHVALWRHPGRHRRKLHGIPAHLRA